MPRPLYIIPAHVITEDRTSNLVSIASVVELVEIARSPVQEDDDNERRLASISVLAVWMKQDGDDAHVFEHEFAILVPGEEPRTSGRHLFQFDATKFLRRFRLQITGIPPLSQSCIIELESRVRRETDGESEWITQSYPIVVEVSQANPGQHEALRKQAAE